MVMYSTGNFYFELISLYHSYAVTTVGVRLVMYADPRSVLSILSYFGLYSFIGSINYGLIYLIFNYIGFNYMDAQLPH